MAQPHLQTNADEPEAKKKRCRQGAGQAIVYRKAERPPAKKETKKVK